MHPSDIITEFYKLPRLTQANLDWLVEYGVAVKAMIEPHPLFTGEAHFDGNAMEICSPFQKGERCLFILALDLLGQAEDIVAWSPNTGQVGSWLGRAAMLGEEWVCGPRLEHDGALPVFRDPGAWLLAGRRGIAVLAPTRAAWRLSGTTLLAEDVEHGVELQRSLAIPMPQIVVHARRLEAAA